MLTATLTLLLLAQQLPENPGFDLSGMPRVNASGVRVQTHSVMIELVDKVANVTSTTVFRSDSSAAMPVTVTVPRLRIGDANSGQPSFRVSASWSGAPMSLTPTGARGSSRPLGDGKSVVYRSDLMGRASMKAGGTHSLRVSYSVPFGRAGFDQKQRIAGYMFDSGPTIGQLNVAYRYGGRTVFRLPEAHPNWGWQVGAKGVFIRQENFAPSGELTYITFYPGGFENIGGR
jgi:hypothetical protein